MAFESIYQKIIKKLETEGRVKTLSIQQTHSIDNELAKGLAPIKEEFYRKHNTSRYYISELERTTAQV
jgi:hypothetical protein